MYRLAFALLLALGLGGGAVSAATLEGGVLSLHTLGSFVEFLASRSIIPRDLVYVARDIVRMIEGIEHVSTPSAAAGKNEDAVTLKTSQLIEHANRTYAPHTDVQGLLLIVTNASTSNVVLEARRSCQVSYRIYDAAGTLRYDSANRPVCQSGETVTYILRAGATRMFPVTHRAQDYDLAPGTYRFVLDYPGYGSGELGVEVTGEKRDR